ADIADLVLREKRFVADRLAVNPRRVLAGDDRDDARISPRLVGVDALDLRVRLRAEKNLAVDHVRQDEIVAVDGFPGDFLVRVDARDRLSYDGEIIHEVPLFDFPTKL